MNTADATDLEVLTWALDNGWERLRGSWHDRRARFPDEWRKWASDRAAVCEMWKQYRMAHPSLAARCAHAAIAVHATQRGVVTTWDHDDTACNKAVVAVRYAIAKAASGDWTPRAFDPMDDVVTEWALENGWERKGEVWRDLRADSRGRGVGFRGATAIDCIVIPAMRLQYCDAHPSLAERCAYAALSAHAIHMCTPLLWGLPFVACKKAIAAVEDVLAQGAGEEDDDDASGE